MPAKILVVEDHADSLEVLTIQLKRMGYDVIEAMTGQEGIEKAGRCLPEAVIMDLGLPDMNGLEATQKLKQNPRTAHIPVIAHTAWPEEVFKSKAEKAGMADFLTKPTSASRFRSTIEKWLKLRDN
ncbi:response regulator [bacterium]|nr:MAG: response regulator [bacterium]